jgi:hypothetical protein
MTDKTSNSQKPINRREMLKKSTLATGGAITAAAFLDGKWVKPIVKTGVLPEHAQASACADYNFTPVFTYTVNGDLAFGLGVDVVPVPPNGPISYEITGTTDITLTPVLVDPKSGNLTGGHADFPGDYIFNVTGPNPTVTIKWKYGGCYYPQTYGITDFPEPV